MSRTVSNSSVAVDHDIICKRGDSFWRGFQYYTDAVYTEPIDITEASFALQVIDMRTKYPVLTFTIGDGLEITAINTLEAIKTATEMNIEKGNYKYDLQKTLLDGTVTTIMKGTFTVEDDETR